MARAGLLANYDSLAHTGRSLLRDLDALQHDSSALKTGHARAIRQDVEALASSLSRKLTLTEYLKSDNALLRNSLAYFAQSLGSIRERGRDGKTRYGNCRSFARDAAIRRRPRARHSKRRRGSTCEDFVGAVERGQPGTADVHGRLIVQVLPRVDALLAQIIASPIAGQAPTNYSGPGSNTAR
jgi:hypothetical protein